MVVKGSKKMFWVNKFVPKLAAALQARGRDRHALENHAMNSAPATRACPAIVLKGSGSDMKTNINALKKQRFPAKPRAPRHGAY